VLNFIAIDLQLYRIFNITRVSFFAHSEHTVVNLQGQQSSCILFSRLCICGVLITAATFLLHDDMHNADNAVARCLSVCLSVRQSVTCRYSVKTAEHILKLFFTVGLPRHSSFSIPNGMAIF